MIFDLLDYIIGAVKIVFYNMIYGKRCRINIYGKFSKMFRLRIFDKGEFRTGKNVVFREGVIIRINGKGKVLIGDDVGLNNYCLLNAMEQIEIGSHTIIGQGVKIYDHDHNYKVDNLIRYSGFNTGAVKIGENTWIGSNCIILKGVTIGNNCVIGAGTVIKKSISDNSIVYNDNNYINKYIER